MAQIFNKLGNRIRKLMGRMDQYQEAITFAEAGQPEHVQELLMTGEGEERTAAKLLVVGRESTFSREIIDYALGRRLFELAPEPKQFETIPGAGHNDTVVVGGRPYFARIGRFLDEVAP